MTKKKKKKQRTSSFDRAEAKERLRFLKQKQEISETEPKAKRGILLGAVEGMEKSVEKEREIKKLEKKIEKTGVVGRLTETVEKALKKKVISRRILKKSPQLVVSTNRPPVRSVFETPNQFFRNTFEEERRNLFLS